MTRLNMGLAVAKALAVSMAMAKLNNAGIDVSMTQLDQCRNLFIEPKNKDMEEKDEMLYALSAMGAMVTDKAYGRCKIRHRDDVHKVKAIAKRRKKNKNKKTHRKS